MIKTRFEINNTIRELKEFTGSKEEEKKKTDILNEWLAKKQSETYIRIKEGWRNCEFKYDGWIKK